MALTSTQSFRLFVLVLVASLFQENLTAPSRSTNLGFVYNGGKADAPVQLEAFVDLTCPDSRRAWLVLREIADSYGAEKLRLTVYLFPLPYHRNSHVATSSAFFVEAVNSSRVFDWMSIMFNNLNSVTGADTKQEAVEIIAALGKDIGIDEVLLKEGLTQHRYSTKVVISFKYGVKRGVYATPFYFMNGRFLKDDTPFWPANKWKQVIDKVLEKSRTGMLNYTIKER